MVLKVYLDSGWRKVCSHTAFDINEADVICKQLSYTFAVRYTSVSGYVVFKCGNILLVMLYV